MEQEKSTSRAKKIFGVGALCFVVLGFLIYLLCNVRIQYTTQAILTQERDLQQIWLNRAMDSIGAWRSELMEQARFVSSSEMFRLFITDTMEMAEEERNVLHEPDSLHSSRESLRSMAEQLTYLRDLLKDFTMRRAWTEARVLLPDGEILVGPEFSLPLLESQKAICEKSAETGKPVFGPIRMQDGVLTMDMADPLFEVLGASEPKTVGVLLLSVPMERPLTTFLSNQSEQRENISPRIVSTGPRGSSIAMIESGIVVLEALEKAPSGDYPFMIRKSVDGSREVYSMGASPAGLNWQYILETPAALITARIHEQKVQIYAMGALASLGLALLAAFIWASVTSRQHKERVRELTRLNRQIDQQKTMLESINSSMTAGLLLVDDHDNAVVTNPNFLRIIDRDDAVPPHTPLAEILPSDICLTLQHQMRQVMTDGVSKSTEITIGSGNDKRLYRVTFYPYIEDRDTSAERCAGCVAIFQDITVFRKKAEIQKEREEAMLSALSRAIESVDPSLVGQSDKMANLAARVAQKMEMDDDQKQTLRIASHLSQIGKLFVPRELLTREGELTPEELAEVRRAPEHADKILGALHFDLPIQATVAEMGKKLDENGNIKGTGTKMSACGRALAVINAFIAMTSARSWRKSKRLSTEEAIRILKDSPDFCQNIVAALESLPLEEVEAAVNAHIQHKKADGQASVSNPA